MKRNKRLIALCGVLINLSIGAVYAYSVLKKPLMAQFGRTDTSVAMMFSIAIFFLGLSAAFAGKFVKKYGPKKM
jgi:OFA family oxalate/formate antiporter-like MFS transporter